MLPYRQLSYAVAVADHGGVQAASEKIAISQPALSNAVQKVEQEYGLKIFIRDRPNKLALTSVGRRFIAQAKRLIENAEEFEDLAKNLSKNSSGTIQLDASPPPQPLSFQSFCRLWKPAGLIFLYKFMKRIWMN